MAKYLIVGGVAGGAGVAARLRRLDEKAEITVFERGAHISYANCGLPYFTGGTIRDRSRLFITTPEKFKASLGIDARTGHEVLSIDRKAKTLRIRDIAANLEYEMAYDQLVLSPGAAPLRPPIPGIGNPAVMTLRSVADADAIKARLDSGRVGSAVVVGGGFIGLEMAENLAERGAAVTIVEALEQVMAPLDYEMAALVQAHLREKGVSLRLKDGVSAFEERPGGAIVKLASGAAIEADIVILSVGVRPDTAIAAKAGLELAPNGAIKVDEFFRTSDPCIRAVGDAIEFRSPLLGVPLCIPLAGPANKQARLCADAMVLGDKKPYRGSIGASVAKVFDLTVAATGASEKALAKAGIPHKAVYTHAGNHAGYYPGSVQLSLKAVYDPESGKLLGAQCVGADGADKRIDVVSAFIQKGGTIRDLADFEQAYAPPFSSAKDPLNMLGFIAENDREGRTRTVSWSEVEAWKERGAFLLDARSAEEFELGAIPGAVNIPHTELRARLSEVPRGKPVLVNCAVGLRGYLAERVLRQNGYDDTGNLSGGYKTWKAATSEIEALKASPPAGGSRDPAGAPAVGHAPVRAPSPSDDGSPEAAPETLDACGLQCPGPIIQLKKRIDGMRPGQRLQVLATDPGFARDVRSWCELTGNALDSLSSEKGVVRAVLQKGRESEKAETPAAGGGKGATIIVFSDDMDRALASFVLANGAAASGKDVTMFFTFWGLSVLRKAKPPKARKDFMGAMFGAMLPKGSSGLSLSRMNFLGLGPAMMKSRMKKKNVDQLESMISQARLSGVRMVACQMSMDLMGISASELLDGVEIGGVATYMGAASQSGVNLFI